MYFCIQIVYNLNQLLFQTIYRISKLPLGILYIFSDLIFLVNYYLIGYRKKIVYENLKKSFPEKSEPEILKIRKQFFRNFSDYIVEMMKAMTISEKELKKRMEHRNQELFAEIKSEKKNMILLAGHIFNWEWVSAFAMMIPQENSYPVYRKINDDFWEEKVKIIRNRFGNQALSSREVIKHMLKTPVDGNSAYMFVADQSPHFTEVSYGLDFLNQKTPVFIGYDKISRKLDFAFVYCEMKKIKRGKYQVTYHRIFPEKEQFQEYEVVRKFHQMLEQTIRQDPSNWLWSHKRWKYQGSIKKYAEE